MIRIGLTGTIGAGKSSVGRLFASWGASRIDVDDLARQAVAPGTRALDEIRQTWGEDVMAADGSLDRAELRRRVFADPRQRLRLEEIVHPAIEELRQQRTAQAAASGADVMVCEIPLLFEKGLEAEFDVIVVVDASPALRRARVAEHRGVAAAEFASMEAAQWTGAAKQQKADFILHNEGELDSLESQARKVWEAILHAARERTQPLPATEGPSANGRLWDVDLHMHTSHSHDCLVPPLEVVSHARTAGLHRIAITDHNEIDGAFEAYEAAPELVIVGEEVLTAEGLDLIGLFLTRHIEPGLTFRAVAEEIHAQGGIVYLPHPFDSRRGTTEQFLAGVIECIDAVEGFNARIHDSSRNRRAQVWAEMHGLPLGAGSDAHMAREIGRGRVRVPPFTGASDFLDSLLEGWVEGRPSSHLVHVGSTWAKWRKRLAGSA
ncbi:MAG: dephospho-CoA kinase [Gemmatimonadota bacterium]